jgi:hypothetical protein
VNAGTALITSIDTVFSCQPTTTVQTQSAPTIVSIQTATPPPSTISCHCSGRCATYISRTPDFNRTINFGGSINVSGIINSGGISNFKAVVFINWRDNCCYSFYRTAHNANNEFTNIYIEL